jgi:cytochrome c oxidase cbb3-type subunit 1
MFCRPGGCITDAKEAQIPTSLRARGHRHMDGLVLKAGGWLGLALLALAMAVLAVDGPFAVHMTIVMIACLAALWFTMSSADYGAMARGILKAPADLGAYDDDPVRWGVIATLFWGAAGMAAGLYIALQLAFPVLNLNLEYTTFGRLRPLHTSAVIFAFGGNALIATSFYVVQRTCRARLAFPSMARFVFWGYQLFIVLAATGYLMGVTEAKEYAEPEWYVDLWLTIVWLAYLAVFLGTIVRRKEPHIYVANWFYLAFIITVAMLHVVNNLSMPASLFGSKSYSAFAGVQDALTQWWYGHNAVGFFLTAGFLAMMYYFVPKQAEPAGLQLSAVDHPLLVADLPVHLGRPASPPLHRAARLGADAGHGVLDHAVDAVSWGGMINGLMTLNGAWDKIRTDPIIRMMVMALAFYGMSTFEGPMMSIKWVNSPVALYRLDHRPCPLRRAWLERHDHLRLRLLSGAAPVEPSSGCTACAWSTGTSGSRRRGHRVLRRLDVGRRHHAGPDVARIWSRRAILGQQLRRNGRRDAPDVRLMRASGGLLYLSGFIVMIVNVWATHPAGTIRDEKRR